MPHSGPMRGCLAFLLFAALLIGALALAVVRLALPGLVDSAVRGSPLAHGQPLTVVTNASIEGVFLGGRIDEIEISGRDLAESNASLGTLDVTFRDVSIFDHTFASADGGMTFATLSIGPENRVTADAVGLRGSGTTLTATADFSSPEAEGAIGVVLQDAGVPVDGVHLGTGRVEIKVAGATLPADLRVADGGLTLEAGNLGSIPLIEPPPGSEWRIEGVEVTPAGIRLVLLISLR